MKRKPWHWQQCQRLTVAIEKVLHQMCGTGAFDACVEIAQKLGLRLFVLANTTPARRLHAALAVGEAAVRVPSV